MCGNAKANGRYKIDGQYGRFACCGHYHNEGMQLLPWKTKALTSEEFSGQTDANDVRRIVDNRKYK